MASLNLKNLNTMGLDTNLAKSNLWYAYLPLENILGKEYGNITLHLTRFSIPQLEMMSSEVSFRGYSKEIPIKVLNYQSKQLTLEYLVDDNWHNYKALHCWISNIEGNISNTTDDKITSITPDIYIPIRIYLLDNYKHKVIEFEFESCWIKMFNDIALEQNNQAEVNHSFTVAYDKYTICKSNS